MRIIPSPDNTLCVHPFNQLACKSWEVGVGPTNITPCCNMLRPDSQDPMKNNSETRRLAGNFTAEEIFHSPAFNNLRAQMLAGEKPEACNVCWNREALTGSSSRLGSLEKDEVLSEPVLTQLDISIGENCNLRCRMCSPGGSNKLRIDQNFFRSKKWCS